jgi:putative oxidoreductase
MLIDTLREPRERALTWLARFNWKAPLLGRVAVGFLFASTGWGKIHSLDKVTEFFVSLGIPMPALNAFVVGYSELICGTLLVLGLCTRLATLPLIVSMVVAIATARMSDIHGFLDLVGVEEFTYLCVLGMLTIIGPGCVSIDHWLVKRWWPNSAKA